MSSQLVTKSGGEDWSVGDPKVGYDVPMSVRKGGATGPMQKIELGGNGTAYHAHSVRFECEECGTVRRFATAAFKTTHWCDECDDLRWYEFKWELNR